MNSRFFACAVAAFIIVLPIARATDQIVTDPGDNGGANQLRQKLTAALSTGGGTVTFSIGTTTIVLNGTQLPLITNTITIDGGNTVTVSGANSSVILAVNSGASLTLKNLALTKGVNTAGDGGAVRNAGTLTIDNCKFSDNQTASSFSGGAIWSIGPLTITNSEFSGNKGGNGGAIYPRFSAAVTNITNCNFHDNGTTNTSSGWGGAMLLWDGAPVTVDSSTFTNNTARFGGAIYVFANSSLTMTNSIVQTNNAVASGGALFVPAGAQATLRSTQLLTNSAYPGTIPSTMNDGGGAINTAGTVMLYSCTVTGNFVDTSRMAGGAIAVYGGSTTINNSKVDGNSGYSGGAVANFVATGVLNANASTFNGNSSAYAGTLANSGSMTLTNSTVANNTGNPAYGAGVANFSGGTLFATGCTISGNLAPSGFYGGGLYNNGGASLTNCTISGNSAPYGGGICNQDPGSVSLLNVTISGNSATNGGGIYTSTTNASKNVTLKNTIVASSMTGNFVRETGSAGTFVSSGFNLSDDNSGAAFLTGIGDKSGTGFNANLAPLAYNGGIAQTQLPQTGSAAIDNGTASGAPTRDQRGFIRAGAAPDIGAAEYNGTSTPVSVSSVVSRKTHGGAGTFDITFPLMNSVGVECRSGGANGNHTIIVTFPNGLTNVGGAAVSTGSGSVSSAAIGTDTHQYIVTLTGVVNQQAITLDLANVVDSQQNYNAATDLSLGFLVGDANGDGVVNSADATITRNRSGQPTDATNFRADYNLDGFINSGDATIVRARSGNFIP